MTSHEPPDESKSPAPALSKPPEPTPPWKTALAALAVLIGIPLAIVVVSQIQLIPTTVAGRTMTLTTANGNKVIVSPPAGWAMIPPSDPKRVVYARDRRRLRVRVTDGARGAFATAATRRMRTLGDGAHLTGEVHLLGTTMWQTCSTQDSDDHSKGTCAVIQLGQGDQWIMATITANTPITDLEHPDTIVKFQP